MKSWLPTVPVLLAVHGYIQVYLKTYDIESTFVTFKQPIKFIHNDENNCAVRKCHQSD